MLASLNSFFFLCALLKTQFTKLLLLSLEAEEEEEADDDDDDDADDDDDNDDNKNEDEDEENLKNITLDTGYIQLPLYKKQYCSP